MTYESGDDDAPFREEDDLDEDDDEVDTSNAIASSPSGEVQSKGAESGDRKKKHKKDKSAKKDKKDKKKKRKAGSDKDVG